MFDFSNKTVLVTGGSRGIGKDIALGFAERKARVILTARKADLLEQVVEEIKAAGGEASYVTCDMEKKEQIYNLVEHVKQNRGAVDILVNNSGISPFVKKSEEVDEDLWAPVIQVNLIAPFILCREFGKIMLERGFGRIINVASVGGLVGLPRQIAYSATKGALIQMTKVLAAEWAHRGNITVNALAPGYVETDLTAGMRASEKISRNLLSRTPAARFGKCEEITGAALYLASEYSSYTNGTVIVVDGGTLSS